MAILVCLLTYNFNRDINSLSIMKDKFMKIKKDRAEEKIVEPKDEKQRKRFIDFSHTLGVVDKVKTDLTKVMLAFSIVSMVIFAIYYPYLIYLNYQSIPHLVAYIILFACTIASFVVEMVFKEKKYNTRRDEQLAEEKRAKIAIGTKTFKYLAKAVTVIMALLSTIKSPGSNLSIVSAVLSGAMLCVQMLFELLSACVKRYADYFERAFEMDVENSMIFDLYNKHNKERKALRLEKELYDIEHDDDYETEKQNKIIAKIVQGAEKYRNDKEDRKTDQKANIKMLKQKISAKLKEKKDAEKERKREDKLQAKYQKEQSKASKETEENFNDLQELSNQSNI